MVYIININDLPKSPFKVYDLYSVRNIEKILNKMYSDEVYYCGMYQIGYLYDLTLIIDGNTKTYYYIGE